MANKIQTEKLDNLTQRGRGRPPGAVNKATKAFRDTVNDLLAKNSENVDRWLMQVAEGQPEHEIKPAPEKALTILAQLAEYAAPKLSRAEHANADGEAFKLVSKVQFEIVNT